MVKTDEVVALVSEVAGKLGGHEAGPGELRAKLQQAIALLTGAAKPEDAKPDLSAPLTASEVVALAEPEEDAKPAKRSHK